MMNISRPVWLATSLGLAFSLRAADLPPEKLLAADTLGFATAPSWPAAKTALNQSSFGQLWAEPALRPFREKFEQNCKKEVVLPLEKELGLKLADFAALLQGQVTLAFVPSASAASAEDKVGFLFLADTGAKSSELKTNLAAFRKQWVDSGKPLKATTIRGLEFSTLIFVPGAVTRVLDDLLPDLESKAKPPAPKPEREETKAEWLVGQSGALLVVGDSPKAVEKLLILQSGGGVPALAEQAAYAGCAPLFREAQVFGWANVKALIGRLSKEAPQNQAGDDDGPAPLSTAKFVSALGLDALQTLAVTLHESSSGSLLNAQLKAPEAGRKGLFRILNLEAKDSGPPPFIPADAVQFSRSRIDLQKSWNGFEALLAELFPDAAGFLKFMLGMAGKDKNPDFDLRTSLLANLGNDLLAYEKYPRSSAAADFESPPSLVLVGARNAEQLADALTTLTSLMPPEQAKYKEREFLGRKIYSFSLLKPGPTPKAPPQSSAVCYTASGGYVAFSSDPALVEEFLRSSAGSGHALRDKPGLNDAAQKVGGLGTGFFTCENDAETTRAFFEAVRKNSLNAATLLGATKLGGRWGGHEGKGLLSWCDFALLPPYEKVAKYFFLSVGAASLNADGYTLKYFVPMPPPLRK